MTTRGLYHVVSAEEEDGKLRVIDSDAHVIEPPGLWKEYVEPAFRSRIPRPVRDDNGRFCYVADDT